MQRVAVGVSDHGGWAIFVTVAEDAHVLDRRRVELVDEALPALPHHHEAKGLPDSEAIALVERVRASAQRHAIRAFDDLRATVGTRLTVALRHRPPLPPTILERIADYRASNVADWVMYRQALADAAQRRSWPVHWYDSKRVSAHAATAMGIGNFDAYFNRLRLEMGAPWNADHKLALAAAIEALHAS